jgi:hypothetical protein
MPDPDRKSMRSFDDEIASRLREAAESGELAAAQSYGKPFPDEPGWEQTPPSLRMPMKILKDAGVPPPEIALFHERAQLRAAIAAATDDGERQALQQRLAVLEQTIACRLEALGNDSAR